jgi:hypothetical protein
MATYTLIDSEVLTGSQASVTFSAIPATFTDLVVRFAARSAYADVWDGWNFYVNSLPNSVHSFTSIKGNGATASSNNNSGGDSWYNLNFIPAANATSNTFSNGEVYFPNYNSSTNKPGSIFQVGENNNTTGYMAGGALLYKAASAITSITFRCTANFVSGSSFYLYGISNA